MTCTVYRYFGEGGELLYVGMSQQPLHRILEHRQDKPWWLDVVGATFEHHPDRQSAERAERQAILTEHPRYNRARVPVRKRPAPSTFQEDTRPIYLEDDEQLEGDG